MPYCRRPACAPVRLSVWVRCRLLSNTSPICVCRQKLGEPIKLRLREFGERPAALEALSASIQQCDKAVNAYRANDERYAHLDQAEIEKVRPRR